MGKRFASLIRMWSKGRPRWFEDSYYPVKEPLLADAKGNGETFLVDVVGRAGHDVEYFWSAFANGALGKLVLQDRPEVFGLDIFSCRSSYRANGS